MYSFINFWSDNINFIYTLCGAIYWPTNLSVGDVLIHNDEYTLIFLRPISFTTHEELYYGAIHDLIVGLFNKCLLNDNVNRPNESGHRGKLKCPHKSCLIPKKSSGALCRIFKKSPTVHDIFCISTNLLTKSWYEYISTFIKYRYLSNDKLENSEKNIYKLQKQCIHLRKLWISEYEQLLVAPQITQKINDQQ